MKLVWFFLAAASICVCTASRLQCHRCDSRTDTTDVHCEKGINIQIENCTPTEQCYQGSYNMSSSDGKSFKIYIRGCGPVSGGCKAEAQSEQSKILNYRVTQLSCNECDKQLCNSAQSNFSGSKLMIADALFIQLLFIVNKFV